MATRQGKAEARARTFSAQIPDGDALLLDATEELKAWAETQTRPEQANLFSRIPYVIRLFVEPPPRRTIDHVLLLVSSRVLMIAEEEIRAKPPLLPAR